MTPDFSVYSTYIPLLFSLILVWTDFSVKERFPVWLLFLMLSFISAIFFNYAEIESLLYAAVFALVIKQYYKTGLWVYFFVFLCMCLPLLMHLQFIGFHNYKYLDRVRVTENALPFSLYFNLDKALIGLFVLGFACSKTRFKINLKIVMLYLLIMCAVLLGLALAFSGWQWLSWP